MAQPTSWQGDQQTSAEVCLLAVCSCCNIIPTWPEEGVHAVKVIPTFSQWHQRHLH